MISLPLLDQTELTPVTVVDPEEYSLLPRVAEAELTRPPFSMVSVPFSPSPMTSAPLLFHSEPAPVTVTVPSEKKLWAMLADVELTRPPFSMVRKPNAWLPPIVRLPLLSHSELAPFTRTVLVTPPPSAMLPAMLATRPPSSIVREPEPR